MKFDAKWLWVGTLAASFGCGGEPITVYVTGNVSDLVRQPIEGARVTLITNEELAEDRSTTTDALGDYFFEVRGFGSLAVAVEAEGFVRARSTINTVDTPDTGGEFDASAVQDFLLYANTAALQGTIRRNANGVSPVSNLPLRLRINDATVRDPNLVLQVNTDANGDYRFENLPAGASATLFIPSWDEDGDGVPETGAVSQGLTLNQDSVTLLNRDVFEFEGPRAVWSNVANQLVAPNANIEVRYNVAMRPEGQFRTITLSRLDNPGGIVAATSSFSSDGTLLTITPIEPLTQSQRYRISVQAEAASTGQGVSYNQDFRVTGSNPEPATPTNFRLVDPSQDVDYNTLSFSFRWDAVPDADQYSIYVRSLSGPVTEWVRTNTLNANNPLVMEGTFSIPSAVRDPQTGWAFGNGETVEFAVAAVRDGAESAPSQPVAISDNVCLRVSTAFRDNRFDSWNNAGGEDPAQVAALVRFVGPVDRSNAPTFSLPSGLGAASFSVQWVDRDEAQVIGTVPPMTDGSGTLTFDVSGLTDPSGNPICENNQTITATMF